MAVGEGRHEPAGVTQEKSASQEKPPPPRRWMKTLLCVASIGILAGIGYRAFVEPSETGGTNGEYVLCAPPEDAGAIAVDGLDIHYLVSLQSMPENRAERVLDEMGRILREWSLRDGVGYAFGALICDPDRLTTQLDVGREPPEEIVEALRRVPGVMSVEEKGR